MPKYLLFLAVPLWAQEPLSLRDAVALALRQNPAVTAADESTRAAAARVDQARSGARPKINYSESFARSDNPVFVFGSLLTQHQFSEKNFAVDSLNRPDFINNFQSRLTIDQPLYDAGQTRRAIHSQDLGRQLTEEESRRVRMETIAAVARAYNDVLLAAESLASAQQSVRSAAADLQRAESVRSAGMATDADVLSIRVHLAAMTEQRIRRVADLDVARATLNDALGMPLDTPHSFSTTLSKAAISDTTLQDLERDASTGRPEMHATRLAASLAQTQSQAAHATLLPQVGVHAAFEADRQRFVTRAGTNWLASVTLQWNLFNGGADKARIAEAASFELRAKADTARTESAVRLEVRRAWAGLRAAEQRIEVSQAAMAESDESLRITQNRYAAGMATVTDLLRAETAVLETRTMHLTALHDQRQAALQLELSSAHLTPTSEVLN